MRRASRATGSAHVRRDRWGCLPADRTDLPLTHKRIAVIPHELLQCAWRTADDGFQLGRDAVLCAGLDAAVDADRDVGDQIREARRRDASAYRVLIDRDVRNLAVKDAAEDLS